MNHTENNTTHPAPSVADHVQPTSDTHAQQAATAERPVPEEEIDILDTVIRSLGQEKPDERFETMEDHARKLRGYATALFVLVIVIVLICLCLSISDIIDPWPETVAAIGLPLIFITRVIQLRLKVTADISDLLNTLRKTEPTLSQTPTQPQS